MNICIVTLDSLRWDVMQAAKMKNITRFCPWEKCGAHGTNTLPSHVAMFQGGQAPYSLDKKSRYYVDKFRLFRPELQWDRDRLAVFKVPEAENIVRGLARDGYRTVGLGGVHWFSNQHETSNFWGKWFFDTFIWEPCFAEDVEDSFENQLWFLNNYPGIFDAEQLFLFINVATTHIPFFGNGGWQGQFIAAQRVDRLFPQLIDVVPKPCHFFVLADHGTCFAEIDDGLTGHGFVHESVMTVGMADFVII